jgi:hypothetical protein
MARPSSSRLVLVLLWTLSLCGAFVGGIAFEHSGREAQAQSPGVSTLFVPAGGLVFRTLDGKPIARISETGKGGNFELFDSHQDVGLHLQPGRPAAALVQDNPYSVDERDPWTPSPANPY